MRKRKPEILKRTDHRLDLSPAGRNLFISRDKQAQDRAARKIKNWMRVVMALAALLAAVAAGLLAASYLVPWFREELTAAPAESSALSSGVSSLPAAFTEYDEMGLPIYGDDVCLYVVNAQNPAGQEYAPELTGISGVSVDSHIVDALRLMMTAAKSDGLALTFTEGYVSYGEQEKRFNAKVEELREQKGLSAVMAKVEAKALVPAAGESDFQSGMCLRLEGDPETFDSSKTYSWLKANMGKYGFVFRYPEYKEDHTGLTADPTVIRYVGAKHAAAMQQRSMCLEEYLSYLDSQ